MISGIVNAALEATIRIVLRCAAGKEHEFEAVVDSGFDGFLTLPASVLVSLGYPQAGNSGVLLADGSYQSVPTYDATVVWEGMPTMVAALDVGRPMALVGMALLQGHRLCVDVIKGGPVTIEVLP